MLSYCVRVSAAGSGWTSPSHFLDTRSPPAVLNIDVDDMNYLSHLHVQNDILCINDRIWLTF